MGIVVKVESIRPAWNKAKKDLFNSLRGQAPGSFWKHLGNENRLNVIISGYNGSFPVIDVLEFDDEQSYAWFMLKWA
jgi:hypothetical protein